jgi:hypothetical protein
MVDSVGPLTRTGGPFIDRLLNSTMSASTTARRRSTVHDFSTLRLHPDGSRVAINSPTRSDHDSRTHKTGRDARGNRIARDAAGLGVVPKRTVIHEGEDKVDDDEDDGDEVRNIKPRMSLRRKRRRIDDNVEFLGDSGNVARRTGDTAIADREAAKWPVPSSVRSSRSFFFVGPLTVRAICLYYRTC